MVVTIHWDWVWDFVWITLFWLNNLPSVVYAENTTVTLSLTTSPWTSRPRPHLPNGTWQIPTRPDVRGLQLLITLARVKTFSVFAFYTPPGPSRATGFGALRPLSRYPFRYTIKHKCRQIWAYFLIGFVEWHISRDEKSIFNLGGIVVSASCQELDGDGFFQLPEALDPLQCGGRATVL